MATASGGVHLLGSKLNLSKVRDVAREELKKILGKNDTKKVIVWDETLIGPIGLIAEVPFLKEQGVYKMVRLPAYDLPEQYPEATEFYFFVQPRIKLMEEVIESIRSSSRKTARRKYSVVFVPQRSLHCVEKLAESKLTHGATVPAEFYITDFHMDMLPLDSDVISLDINTAFKDLYLEEDPAPLHQAAKVICKLQSHFGVIPKIVTKGHLALRVARILERMRREMFGNSNPQATPGAGAAGMAGGGAVAAAAASSAPAKDSTTGIDTLIILDRTVDLVTPLSTPLNYEALIDEIYGIKYTSAKFPRERFQEDVQQVRKGAPPPQGPLGVVLNSGEKKFAELRDIHINAVPVKLMEETKKITKEYKERHDAKDMTELRHFVKKLPYMQVTKTSLSRHTTIAELVKDVCDKDFFVENIYAEHAMREDEYGPDKPVEYILECLGKGEPVAKVLRLMCLHSVLNNGLKPKLFDYYRKEILERYGHNHLLSLHNLEKAMILKQLETRSNLPAIKKHFRLLVSVDDKKPTDISYVFSGYAPLSIRLIQELAERGGPYDEFVQLLPGPGHHMNQPIPKGQEKKKRPTSDNPQVVLVFFLGGCSYSEISALRFLSQREDAITEYIVGTTHITNGTEFVNSLLTDTPLYSPSKLYDNQLDDNGQGGAAAPAPPTSRR